MRCAKCGRLTGAEAPKWALPCMCGDVGADKGPQVPEHPCGKCGRKEKESDGYCRFRHSHTPLSCPELAKWADNPAMDACVAAIRSDKAVGRGSCSSIDECMDRADIVGTLAVDGIMDPAKAVEWARDHERLFLEQGLNQRWGEDDDPQVGMMREFEEKCKE